MDICLGIKAHLAGIPNDLRPEYRRGDLGPGVRGKYLESYRSGTNLVLLPLTQRPSIGS